jgi:hypothetical protein
MSGLGTTKVTQEIIQIKLSYNINANKNKTFDLKYRTVNIKTSSHVNTNFCAVYGTAIK